jgi:hypothetical protein
MRSVWLGLVLAVACGGNGDDRPGLPPAGNAGSSSSGGSRNQAGNAGNHAAAGDEAQGGGDAAEGGAGSGNGGSANVGGDAEAGAGIVYETAGAPAMAPPGVCRPEMSLAGEQAQNVGASNVTLLAMTNDELSVAFTTGAGNTLALHVADRASPKAAFAEVSVTVPEDWDAGNGATLSANGLRLLLVSSDHGSFGVLSRAQRGDAFAGEIDTTPFQKINSLKPMSGESVGWPVLSSDGKALYYVTYFGRSWPYQAALGKDGIFGFGSIIEGDEGILGGKAGEYKLFSGLAADQRAIFYYDEATQHTWAAFRSREGGPFYDEVDLGARRGAAPNTDCGLVYSSVESGVVAQPVK